MAQFIDAPDQNLRGAIVSTGSLDHICPIRWVQRYESHLIRTDPLSPAEVDKVLRILAPNNWGSVAHLVHYAHIPRVGFAPGNPASLLDLVCIRCQEETAAFGWQSAKNRSTALRGIRKRRPTRRAGICPRRNAS
jgi:hypothetical protein